MNRSKMQKLLNQELAPATNMEQAQKIVSDFCKSNELNRDEVRVIWYNPRSKLDQIYTCHIFK